jgi:hypothetical protein
MPADSVTARRTRICRRFSSACGHAGSEHAGSSRVQFPVVTGTMVRRARAKGSSILLTPSAARRCQEAAGREPTCEEWVEIWIGQSLPSQSGVSP